jgi:mannose-6-phosphate isomerase-like protein (cupin superfamily)
MGTITRPEHDVVWWQGNLFTIKGRGEGTGGALGLAEARMRPGMATPLHVHHREDEAFYILEGKIRFRRGDEEFTGEPGDFVFGPREVPHSFKVLDGGARVLVLMTPAGLEHMFVEGGLPVRDADEPPPQQYDMERVLALAQKYGWDVIGPPML